MPAKTLTRSESWAADGKPLALIVDGADVIVELSTSGRIEANAKLEYWSSDKEWMEAMEKDFRWQVDHDAKQNVLRLIEPETPRRFWVFAVEMSLAKTVVLKVPKGTALSVEDEYGDVDVAGIGGPLDLKLQSGGLKVSGAKGKVTIWGTYGDVEVSDLEQGPLSITLQSGGVTLRDIAGPATLDISYGDIDVRDLHDRLDLQAGSGSAKVVSVSGAIEASLSYGDLTVEELGGDLVVRSTSGNVVGKGIKGGARVESQYGDVELESVVGAVRVENSSGSVRVKTASDVDARASYGDVEVRGASGTVTARAGSGSLTIDGARSVQAEADYGSFVRISNVPGSVSVRSQSAPVDLAEIGGPIDVNAQYGDVTVRGAREAMKLRAQSGTIEVSRVSGKALDATHSFEAAYGDVSLAWPRSAAPRYRIESTGGSVRSDFPGTADEFGSRTTISSRDGRGDLVAISQSGSVRLKME